MEASNKGYTETLNLLIDNGADVELQDDNKMTALMIASNSGHIEIVKMLIKKGVNINYLDKYGRTALSIVSCDNGHIEIAKILIEAGADVNINFNPNVNIQNRNGKTALYWAKQYSNTEIVEMLKNAGAKE